MDEASVHAGCRRELVHQKVKARGCIGMSPYTTGSSTAACPAVGNPRVVNVVSGWAPVPGRVGGL